MKNMDANMNKFSYFAEVKKGFKFKLLKVINWSWWWVLSPLWILAILELGIYILVGIWLWWLSR